MMHKALAGALLASLIGSCLLTGCASPFERFYEPAGTAHGSGVTPSATSLLVCSRDADRDGKRLAQAGYVLIGTSSYDGAIDLSYQQDAAIQGKKVGAAVVLLEVHAATILNGSNALHGVTHYMPGAPAGAEAAFEIPATGTVCASYWAKAKSS
jgi:hypothetical protein